MSDYVSSSEFFGDKLIDEKIIIATQAGLPLTVRPFHTLSDQLGFPVDIIKQRFQAMLDAGKIRRIAVVPNHYKLGFCANGMSVWNVPDEHIRKVGTLFGSLDYVSHCYHRPRHLPYWPYSVFAMVHGRDRGDVERQVDSMAELIRDVSIGHSILYSKRILKKTGLRFKFKSAE